MKELVIIMDKSGSMYGKEKDTIGSFNNVIKQRINDNYLVTTSMFSDKSEIVHDRIPIRQVNALTDADYVVGGNSALIDAVGKMIHHIGCIHHYARREDVPERTIFVIMSDGEDNCSHIYSLDEVKEKIKAKKEIGWTFIFLGTDLNTIEISKKREKSVNVSFENQNNKKSSLNAQGILDKIISFISDDNDEIEDDDV